MGVFLGNKTGFVRPGHIYSVTIELNGGYSLWQAIRFKTRLDISNKKVINTIDIID